MKDYKDEKEFFYKIHGYKLNLKDPKSFDEKIVYKKLFDRNPLLPLTADKYRVREYIKQKLGTDKYLIPLLYVTDKPKTIPFENLQKPYIIKANHGCSWNIIVEDGLDKVAVLHRLGRWLKGKFGIKRYEWAYSEIKPLILIEKLLKDKNGNIPNDYRFWMFDGKCRLISITSGRFINKRFTFYDTNWNKLNIKRYGVETNNIKKPTKLKKMISLAEKLSIDFDFVRIDFFVVDENIYCGEISHYPTAGMARFEPREFDFKLGKYWNLKEYKNMSNYKIKEILGSKMCLIPSDIGLSKQLIEHGIREEASVKFMKKILKPNWTVIDIGANLGYYALLEAKLCKKVYAIEPIKESVLALKESIKLNKYKNIKVDRLAIGNKDGEFEINLSKRLNWATMVDRDKTSKNYQKKFNSFKKNKEKIKTMTLNRFVRKQKIKEINLIRMDVEGFEIEILENIDKTVELMPKDSFLSVEFHPVIFDNREMLIKTFEKIIVYYGFEIAKITWHKQEFDMSNTEFKNWLLKKNACPQVFFRRRIYD